MKKPVKNTLKHKDTFLETDIEDSYYSHANAKPIFRKKRPNKKRTPREQINPPAQQ